MSILVGLMRYENENKMFSNMLRDYIEEVQKLRIENRELRITCPLIQKMENAEITKKQADYIPMHLRD